MKKYEIMYILNANLEEEARKELIEKLQTALTTNGDLVSEVNGWGLKDLAYEINFQSKGFYVVVNVEAEDDKGIKEFERLCRIETVNVLRFMCVAL